MNHVKQYKKKKDSTDMDEGVVPERPELSQPESKTEDTKEAVPNAPGAVEQERAAAAATVLSGNKEEEETFEMDADLEELEEKIQRAERRLAKWDRKYERSCRRSRHHHGENKDDGRHESISAEEYARERRHIEHVLRKLQQRQESLWNREGHSSAPAP